LSAGLPRPERIRRILERDGHECVWCRRPLDPGRRDLTFEHVIPRLKGGPACDAHRPHLARELRRLAGP
jgi:5-methylcytosine-specific restriction endonuclease McrA